MDPERIKSPEARGLMKLPVAVPAMMEEAFGYGGDCRYVAFCVSNATRLFGYEVGAEDHVPVDPACWRAFIDHPAILPLLESLGFTDQPMLSPDELMSLSEDERSEYFQKTRQLVLDRDERVLFIGPTDQVFGFLTMNWVLTKDDLVGESDSEEGDVVPIPIPPAVHDAFRAWLDDQLQTAMAQFRLAHWYKRQLRFEEALGSLQRAAELEDTLSRRVGFQHCLGLVYTGLQRYTEAIIAFEQVIRMQPDVRDVYRDLGMAYFGAKRFEDAVGACSKVIALEPGDAEGYVDLGLALAAARRDGEAVRALKDAIQLDPQNATAHAHLGAVYTGMGDTASAVREYRIAKDLGLDTDLEEELFKLL